MILDPAALSGGRRQRSATAECPEHETNVESRSGTVYIHRRINEPERRSGRLRTFHPFAQN
jgi:hypothetical protein